MKDQRLTIKASKREETNPKKVRNAGFIPALIYNHGKTEQIQVSASELYKLFDQGVTESTLININLGGDKDETAFIKEYQKHPLNEDILHVDFFRVTFGEKIRTSIPIQLEGKPIGVKEGGVLETFLHEVDIETYPRHLSSSLQHDISHLKIGDSIHIEDIKLPPESKILMDGNPIVCQVSTSAKLESTIEEALETTDETPEEEGEKAEESD